MAARYSLLAGLLLAGLWLVSARIGLPDRELPTREEIQELLTRGHAPQAERAARRLLSEVEARQGPGSLEAARVIDLLVESLIQLKMVDSSELLSLAERALEIKSGVAGSANVDRARSLGNLGRVLRFNFDLDAAEEAYREAYAERERLRGPDDPLTALSLADLAGFEQIKGEPIEARRHIEEALSRLEAAVGPDDVALVNPLILLGTLLDRMDADPLGSRAVCERALDIVDRNLGGDSPIAVGALNCIAISYWRRGEYAEAREIYERQLGIQDRWLPPHLKSSTLLNLGILLEDTGDYPLAREFYERSYEVHGDLARQRLEGPRNNADNYARLLMKMGEYEQAQSILEKILAARTEAWGPSHPFVFRAKGYLGRLLAEMGEVAAARKLVEENLRFEQEHYGPEHPRIATSLLVLGRMMIVMGDDEMARPVIERAISLLELRLGRDHPWTSEALFDLALLDWQAGRPDDSLERALRAAAALRRNLGESMRNLTQQEALSARTVRRTGLDIAMTIMASAEPSPARLEQVWNEVIHSRAFVLDEIAERQRLLHDSSAPGIDSLWNDLQRASARLARLSLRGPDDGNLGPSLRQLESAVEDRGRIERELAEKSAAFRTSLTGRRARFADVRAALPAGAGLVAYVEYGRVVTDPAVPSRGSWKTTPHFAALVLPGREEVPRVVSLGSVADVETAVRGWRAEIGRAPRDAGDIEAYETAGGDLRKMIWDPVSRELEGLEQVFVVPDGVLDLVSLETLPLPANRYLLDDGPRIHYLTAERDLIDSSPDSPGTRGLLIVGDPDFEAGPRPAGRASANGSPARDEIASPPAPCGDPAALRFDPLPGTGLEIEDVARLWIRQAGADSPAGRILELRGPAASEATFKRRATEGHRVIHVATHGFFPDDGCPPAGEEPSDRYGASPSPSLRTGLALAGANRRAETDTATEAEDGMLTAEEIATLDLRGVEWAVLSACGTGLGKVQPGEGVLGLRRAFQVAGARTVIMSLWSVNDHSARDWIRRLYSLRLEGASTCEATHGASLGILRDRREAGLTTHPYYWGGFVGSGDWR